MLVLALALVNSIASLFDAVLSSSILGIKPIKANDVPSLWLLRAPWQSGILCGCEF